MTDLTKGRNEAWVEIKKELMIGGIHLLGLKLFIKSRCEASNRRTTKECT